MEKQKTKLGARILSTKELNAILPNAESVFAQIEVFRNNIPSGNSTYNAEQHEIEQKTNNIGIMGCRGAGKTSILKTYYHKLKNENVYNKETGENKRNCDIILPIMIPENMSAGTTLMDAVLGRMKSIVEEREKENEKDKYKGDCIYSGRDSLEKQYNELVKQYCYIKKDYRDILIQEFTTEQNYVDKTKKVFSSDSEFIKLFHQFVNNLLQRQEESEEKKTEKNPMLFLFIDDIDLNANRCMDIVRTLLVYLSHPRIVTFISGDMETFEEELTLEFLRQEGALRRDVFEETYYAVNGDADGSSLLERKKTLAYEYLKKIIPPAYRRTIRYWALEERGNYRIEGDKGNASQSLAELLMEVTKDQLDDLYFVYREDSEQKCMRLAFHMFDDTARGLNNVYNVLQEIYDIQTKEKDMTDEERTLLFWRLIETMVDSKSLYASHKSELLTKIMVLGQKQVKIDFANGYQLLYGEEKKNEKENGEIEADKVSKKIVERFSAEDRFAMFYLIDFATRLFRQNQDVEGLLKYVNLEMRIIQEYISDEEIDGKIASKKELLGCIVDREEERKFHYDSIQRILIDFLKKCNFVVVLHLIRYLGRTEIYDILENDSIWYDAKTAAYKIAYAFFKSGQAANKSEETFQNSLAELWIYMKDTLLSLLNKLSLNPWIIYGRQVTAGVSVGAYGLRFMDSAKYGGDLAEASFWNIENCMTESKAYVMQQQNFLWAEYESQNAVYWIYYEKKLREKETKKYLFDLKSKAEEMISAGLTKTIMNLLQEQNVMKQFEIRALEDVDYNDLSDGKAEKEKRDIQVIEQIDRLGLWDSEYAKSTVCRYLKRRVEDFVYEMGWGRIIFDATQFVTESYAALVNCDKGSSGKAVVYGLGYKIRRVLFLSVNEGQQEQRKFSDGKYYLRLEQALIIWCLLEEFLNIHSRAYYGKKEARKLLMEVRELPLLPHTAKWDAVDEELRKREGVFFEKNPYLLREEAAEELENNENGKEIIENIRKMWYDVPGGKSESMRELISEYLGEAGEKDYGYFQYLVQKSQLEKMKTMWREKEEPNWSEMEPAISEKDYLFIFHSYLRYLQVNDDDAKNAGVRAEEIARLAEYMLDGEIKADKKIQSDFYQMISEELSLTEEEFEKLF